MNVWKRCKEYKKEGNMIEKIKYMQKRVAEKIKECLWDESGIGVVEIILILVGIFTPYYGVGIRCMA